MSFYDNQLQYTDDELHRQHYIADRQQTDTMHSSSDASSKSEQQMKNIYHQQNGFLMKSKNQTTNNNECELASTTTATTSSDDHVPLRKPKQMNNYGKILNSNKITRRDHRNGMRVIPMLPSPPKTPPPPLNAKLKDHHESSNRFYQDYHSNMHLSNTQQYGNMNNNNEVTSRNHFISIGILPEC